MTNGLQQRGPESPAASAGPPPLAIAGSPALAGPGSRPGSRRTRLFALHVHLPNHEPSGYRPFPRDPRGASVHCCGFLPPTCSLGAMGLNLLSASSQRCRRECWRCGVDAAADGRVVAVFGIRGNDCGLLGSYGVRLFRNEIIVASPVLEIVAKLR